MSTMEVLAAGWRGAREASARRREQRRASRVAGRVGAVLVEHGLAVLGLASFVGAGLLVAIPLGLAVAGVAFFILELRVGE